MPTKPQNVKMNADAKNADYLNAIRTSASTYYQENVPIATYDAASVRDVGRIVLNSTTLTNEFYSALVNQFAFIFGSSKMFYNKWVDFKKGLIGLGELVEEFFVQIALPNNYNPDIAATEIFKRVIADVQTAIYRINVKTFYKTTINRPLLEMAFTTEGGMADLIGKVFTSMAAACEVDQMNAIKYLLARKILDGKIKTVPINTPQTVDLVARTKSAARQMKYDLENFFFPRTDYNEAGVMNWVNNKDDVTFMLTTEFSATYDIDVLAAAFNLDYANFMGRVKRVDSLTNIDFQARELLVTGKGNKQRIVFINDKIIHAVREYLKVRNSQPEYLFISRNGGKLHRSSVNRFFNQCSDKITPHSLRHYFCSRALEMGYTMAEVSNQAGHASERTTAIYTNASRQKMKEKANLL